MIYGLLWIEHVIINIKKNNIAKPKKPQQYSKLKTKKKSQSKSKKEKKQKVKQKQKRKRKYNLVHFSDNFAN